MFQPANFQPRSADEIDAAVAYALGVIQDQAMVIERADISAAGATVLELGPGPDFGAALALASKGAKVIVADRFLSGWQEDYHREFYRRLADAYNGPNEQILAASRGGYEATALIRLSEPAEAMPSIPSGAVDFTYSGAVLEHVMDIGAVAKEIARVTRPGGRGAHHIDLRYHSNFDRPLDHLLMPEDQFAMVARDTQHDFGNRLRASEFEAALAAAGFVVLARSSVAQASPAYLDEFIPSLRTARSAYRLWPAEDLGDVGPRFLIEKAQGAAAAATILRGETALAMMSALKMAALAEAPQAAQRELKVSPSAIRPEHGVAWVVDCPDLPEGDRDGRPHASPVQLLEDGEPLGPPHALHDVIRTTGGGRFSHWGRSVYFSTSDNSSPLTNGRRYSLRWPA